MTEQPAQDPQQQQPATDSPQAARSASGPRAVRRGSGGAQRPARRPAKPAAPPPIPEREDAPERLIVGRVSAAHGVRGEFRMAIITNHPDHLRTLRTVYLGEAQEPWQVSGRIRANPSGKEAIVRLVGLDSAEAAAARRGELVRIDRADAPTLPEGEYYHYQLIGLDVMDEADTFLGRLAEIIETGANDVYVVRGVTGEVLLPAIEGVILSVDPAGGRMVVRVPEYW